jgi:hypothetical protein
MPRVPTHILVIDSETTTDTAQRLLFLTYRFCSVSVADGHVTSRCLKEGLVYANDLPTRDRLGYQRLRDYAAQRHLIILSQATFIKTVLWDMYRGRIWIVGFNLLFDLSRIAMDCGETRIRNRYDHRFANGFSFIVWAYYGATGTLRPNPYRPRIALRAIDRTRAFKAFLRPGLLDDVNMVTRGAA